jgi:hypothetical protein
VVVRIVGVFLACHGVARILRAPLKTGNLYGISFITQAGVSIGLASMIPHRFPEGGEAVFTLLLAAIVINQVIGPIAFKVALEQSGEAKGAVQKQAPGPIR